VEQARVKEEEVRAHKGASFFDEQPQLKTSFKYIPFEKGMKAQVKRPRMFRDSDYQAAESESTKGNTQPRPSLAKN